MATRRIGELQTAMGPDLAATAVDGLGLLELVVLSGKQNARFHLFDIGVGTKKEGIPLAQQAFYFTIY